MTTYSFTQTANGMIEAVVTQAHGIAYFPRKVFPPSRIREIRLAQNEQPFVVIDVDTTADNVYDYQINPATDRLTLGTTVYEPGDLTPDALLDVLKASVVFQKANSGSGGPGYKSYVALLNQNTSSVTSGTLEVGKEYKIHTYNGTDDFTNVGAASNTNGTYFIATGTTPAEWGSESVLLTDFVIVATVQNAGDSNYLGSPVYTHDGAGYNMATLSGAFTIGKTIVLHQAAPSPRQAINVQANYNENYIELYTYFDSEQVDGSQLIRNISIEIRVYL